jgi:hypothetical protein
MAKGPEIPKTDSAEIEILIERLKQNKLERRDRTTLMHGDGLGQSPATEEYVDKAAVRLGASVSYLCRIAEGL